MHLWQMDLVGRVPLTDGWEYKLVTVIDDHSRFVVIAPAVAVPSARAVCSAFTTAMRCYGEPFEVLADCEPGRCGTVPAGPRPAATQRPTGGQLMRDPAGAHRECRRRSSQIWGSPPLRTGEWDVPRPPGAVQESGDALLSNPLMPDQRTTAPLATSERSARP
jgi:integrase-like protein